MAIRTNHGVSLTKMLLLGCVAAISSCAGTGKPNSAAAPTTANDPIAHMIAKVAPELANPTAAPEVRIIRGSGEFLNRTGPRGMDALGSGDAVDIDLDGVSISDAAQTIIGDILNANYVVDEGVSGTITIHTSTPVSRNSVLSIFEAALQAKGAALIEEGGIYRITTVEQALIGPRSYTIGDVDQQSGVGFGVQVVPLRFISALEMERILKPISTAGAIVRVDTNRNLLVLNGSRRELDSLLEAIRLFDVDWLRGMSFALIPVRASEPKDLARELAEVFSTSDDGALAGMLKFIPNERLNAILAISTQPSYLDQARKWVERLDNPEATGGDQLFVYNVQNRPAKELAQVLNSFLSGTSSNQDSGGLVQPGATAVVSRTEADGQDNATTRQNSFGAPSIPDDRAAGSNNNTRVVADDGNNSLLIYASPTEFQRIGNLLERLDLMPSQVMIEATIAEVTLNDELSYGLRWFFENAESQITFSDANNGAVAPSFPGFSYLFTGNDAKVALSAISSITDVKVVSSPTLMVLDNRTARLQVGDQVPVATQSAVNIANPNTPIVNSVTFRDTGVILDITPRVNDSGMVVLEIGQEVSSVRSTTTSGIDSPTIQQRRIDTTVAIHDGDSLALGGLIEDSRNVTSAGVPFLEKIPLLGEAFKSKTKKVKRTELLILITPRIVRDRDEARAATEEFRERLEAIKPLFEKAN